MFSHAIGEISSSYMKFIVGMSHLTDLSLLTVGMSHLTELGLNDHTIGISRLNDLSLLTIGISHLNDFILLPASGLGR